MYEIRPEAVLTFLNDRNVRFPRFQRKQTWKSEQNLKLAISIFKNYPVGVTIINKADYKGKSTRWLLDGRQRRNALKLMLENPEHIYSWAKSFLKIKNKDQSQEIEDKFWQGIEDYLNYKEQWEIEEEKSDKIKSKEADQEEEEYLGNFFEDDDIQDEATDEQTNITESTDNRESLGNLDELLSIIQTVHKQTTTSSSFSKPFDFTDIIKNLAYVENDGKQIISGKKVTTFIREYQKFATDEYQNNEVAQDSFKAFILLRHQLNEAEEKSFITILEKNWKYIKDSIEIVDIIENRLREAVIGIIETKDLSSTDSQMIFKLINDSGTPLSAVEILSSKPAWNMVVKSPSTKLIKYTESLYKAINTESTNVVKWDYPATLYNRLDNIDYLMPSLSYENHLEKNITLGFKIISGVILGAIKKDDLSLLSTNKKIVWSEDIDEIVNDICNIGKLLSESNYFKCLSSWNQSLMGLTSDAVALNFLFITYKDYIRKNKPYGRGSKQFVSNAIRLADKSIYEYVTKKWRGSSDSKISKNLKDFHNMPDIYDVVSDQVWKSLLTNVIDNCKIADDDIKFSLMKTIIFHHYSIAEEMGPNDVNIKVNVDHIIPQAQFDNGTIDNAENVKNSIFNLCPLPQKENAKKSDKTLNEITDKWLIQQIEKYSHIKEDDFKNYSNVTKWEELKKSRRGFFEEQFFVNRNHILNN